MAKEFKDFDKAYSSHMIAVCRNTWLRGIDLSPEITKWEHPVDPWENETIRNAVYFADGFEEWQLFRVSMKGLTTYEKLYMCEQRYTMYCNSPIEWKMEKCRIDNYILALKRGGLLNVKLEIIR